MRKVSRGEPLRIPAETFNAFVDAAEYAKNKKVSSRSTAYGKEIDPANTAYVKNQSGSDLSALSIAGIDSPIITPTSNADEFNTRSGWNVVTPTSSHFGKFVVLAEAIPAGEIGLAYISGYAPVTLNVDYANFDRADVSAGTSTKLEASWHGSAKIVWKESGTGTAIRAVIQFDTPREVSLLGVTNSEITVDSSGGVSVWVNGSDTGFDLATCHLDWMHGSQNISSGKEVIVKYFPRDAKWRIIHAECE